MGLLIDIYNILDREKIIAPIRDRIRTIVESDQETLSIGERIENQRLLISDITETNFSTNFSEVIDYFGILLATVVETTYLKNRGCIIRNFYCSEYYMYFPSPSEDPSIVSGRHIKTDEKMRALSLGEDTFYCFYAFKSDDREVDFDAMREKLSNIVRQGRESESGAFLSYLKGNGFSVLKVEGIAQKVEGNRFRFTRPTSWDIAEDGQIMLSFDNSEKIKIYLAEDLQEILNFQLL